jgi:spermidine synthase
MSVHRAQMNEEDFQAPFSLTWAIFLISVLGLFLEMLLIRWIGTEMRIFAYLQNTILVICFLGLGLGCFTSRQPIDLRKMLVQLTILVLFLAIPLTRYYLGKACEMLSVLGDLVIWRSVISKNFWLTPAFVVIGLGVTYLLMATILDIFVPIGRLLGRLMDDHPRTIQAYSVNVAGSLVGTWLFVLLSAFYLPPFAWFMLMGMITLFFFKRKHPHFKTNIALLLVFIAISGLCTWAPGALKVVWSPYQKLILREANHQNKEVGKYMVTVNNTGYQGMIDLSESNIRSHPDQFPPEMLGLSQYDIPLLLHPHPQNYLIVGAGSGNDAAGGLRHRVKEVVAVDIDPAIIAMGRNYHPEQPYSSPHVKVVNDDARSFFATCKEKFDVISFGLLDSHTTGAMTNARLDHYVYTRESIARAKSLLADGGILVLSFEAQKPFIADRMAGVLKEIFHEEPIAFRIPFSSYGWGGTIFISGDLATAKQQIAQNPRLAAFIDKLKQQYPLALTYTTKIVTDDWPYVYLESPKIPLLYYLLAVLMFLLLLRSYSFWHASGLVSRWGRSYWHFFFLGAAFLLLEVQNISKASVVLGNTWEVNAVIVSAVLAMILLANLVAYKFPKLPLSIVYTLLIGSCLSLYWVDLSSFAFLPYATKAILIGGLTTLPMAFSGIIFIRSFAIVANKDEALGANMIGALVGALLQSVTFLIGIKALLLIVAGLYFCSLLTKPRLLTQEEPGYQAVELATQMPAASVHE